MSEERRTFRAAAPGRADALVARALGLGLREARGLFLDGRVLVDGRRAKKGDEVAEGALIEAEYAPRRWLSPRRDERVRVLYVDEEVVVVDKPPGMATHPEEPGEGGTAADAVAALFPEVEHASSSAREGGACHRLDVFTSGLCCFARSREAHRAVRSAFSRGEVRRGYVALVEGALERDLVLDAPIAHHPRDRRRMVVVRPGTAARGSPRSARTLVHEVACSASATLVAIRTEGGRRHQVRVHLAEAGRPIVGDVLYGARSVKERKGQLLHAAALGLPRRTTLHLRPPEDFLRSARAEGIDTERAVALAEAWLRRR